MILRTLVTALGALCLSASLAAADVVVFAASSLKEPLDVLAANATGVTISYGGSGTLARQVSEGAPADVIVLANIEWMDVLVEGNHVRPDSIVDIASNSLVLIGPAAMPDVQLTQAAISAALGEGRIALGMTASVPAGIYGKAALENLNLWDAFVDRLAEVDSVRGALTLVARGEAPLGIVYATDANVTPDVRIVATFPEDSHPPIRYLAALTSGASPAAEAFFAALTGPEGQHVLAHAGYAPAIAAGQP